ncbi:hypothetical protein F0U44_18305 [Nocardioides humilatus]|uniref:Uncharacterized protein n=1 Tax=Nocardioides humilatus TaxID=2607660 RepID=A0A5B1L8R8_9ACTN|nr:hypothetical protein [Nocardioides humilatus]KAA1417121.1 hypothetical protein F0U44_18305 [Nocardioides humilatus]
MTDADVAVLLADLAAGDRAAEFSVVQGTWDERREDPSAAALHPWLDAAGVGRLPREQRAEALATRSLRATTWAVAIGRPVLPRDALLVAAWLRHQGIDASLAAVIRRAVSAMPAVEGTCDAGYDALLRAVLHAHYDGDDFPDEELALLVLDYAAVHERIELARAHLDDSDNTTLRPLLADLDQWGPAVAPHLGDCLLDAVDASTVTYVAGEAGDWTAPGVRAALRARFVERRSEAVFAAVKAIEGRQPAIAAGAQAFLTQDVKASSLTRVRSAWDRPERDRLDAALRHGPRRGRGARVGRARTAP